VRAERQLTVLEFFLLALISKGGVNTVYDLRENVGLTWGGIRPSLLRLERWGLVTRSESGKRRRREFQLTPSGEEALEAGWKELVFIATDAEVDLNTVVRAVWIARQFHPMEAASIAGNAAYKREQAATELVKSQPASMPEEPVEIYHWMSGLCRIQQLQAEARALNELTKIFEAQIHEERGDAPRKEVVRRTSPSIHKIEENT
jgi:DNA-binding MarR family transcriptional regulator